MLYALGEYRVGLPIINKIFAESEEVMGRFSRSQGNVYMYWLNWGLHAGRINEGINWFNQAREASGGDAGNVFDLDTRFKLIEVEYYLASGDVKTAAKIIEKIEGENESLTDTDRKYLSLTRMQLFLILKRPNSILVELDRPEWSEDQWPATDGPWAVYKLWYQGMASFQLGDFFAASSAYESAEALARVRLGESHPRRVLISLNKLFVGLMNERRGGGYSSLEDGELKKEFSVLSQSLHLTLPEGSPVLNRVNECFGMKKIGPKASSRRSDWSDESFCFFN